MSSFLIRQYYNKFAEIQIKWNENGMLNVFKIQAKNFTDDKNIQPNVIIEQSGKI